MILLFRYKYLINISKLIYSDKNNNNKKTEPQKPTCRNINFSIKKCVGIFFKIVGDVKNHCVLFNWILLHSEVVIKIEYDQRPISIYDIVYIYTPISNHNIVCVANWNKSQFKIFPIFYLFLHPFILFI